MDASIRAATILNSWSKIEDLIDRESIIKTFNQKGRRVPSAVEPGVDSEADLTIISRAISSTSFSD
jgi:hypothetical protein